MTFNKGSHNEKRVPGLRSIESASDCRVYRANPDGTPGKMLRIEKPVYYDSFFRGKKK